MQQDIAVVQHRKEITLLHCEHVDRLQRGLPEFVESGQVDEVHQNAKIF